MAIGQLPADFVVQNTYPNNTQKQTQNNFIHLDIKKQHKKIIRHKHIETRKKNKWLLLTERYVSFP